MVKKSTPQNISVLSTPEDIWGGPFTVSTWSLSYSSKPG